MTKKSEDILPGGAKNVREKKRERISTPSPSTAFPEGEVVEGKKSLRREKTSSKTGDSSKKIVESQKKAAPKKKGSRKKKKKSGAKEISPYWFIAAAVVAVIAFVLVPSLVGRHRGGEGVEVPKGHYSGYAVDISKYQKDIIWDSLMVLTDAKGRTVRDIRSASEIHRVKYVLIKATEGENHYDALFSDHWSRSAAAGYSRGAYHFFRSSKSPEKQAENFIRRVGNIRHKDLPPILDVETIHRGCSKEELNRRILVWLKAVERHYGRRPIIYTGDSFLRDYLSEEVYGNYPIWVARYGSGTSLKEPRFDGWMMWQFTDRATVFGIPTECDLSVVGK